MVYFESDMICRGWESGIVATAAMMAAISPTWFDWMGPGTLMAQFRGLLGPAHTPPPQEALRLLLFRQAPSV